MARWHSIKTLVAVLFILNFGTPVMAGAFSFTFSWEGLKLCTSGRPNIVFNPPFNLVDVPDGTRWIEFRMIDRDAPLYNHGGGWVRYLGRADIGRHQFKYKSPCPPAGRHRYEWSARAKTAKFGGKTLASATARLTYPK